MNTKQELIDHLESQLELSDEMKSSLNGIETIREEDMFSSK